MIAEDVNFHDYYWGIRTKFRLEIGITNKLSGQYDPSNGDYPDIVWFPEGIFIISTFNTSLSVNSYTISITGKDKMSMLNGELGGQLFASIDFGQAEYQNKIFTKIDATGIASSETLLSDIYYKVANTSSNTYGKHAVPSNKLYYKYEETVTNNNTTTTNIYWDEVGENDVFNSNTEYYNSSHIKVSSTVAKTYFNIFPDGDIDQSNTNYSFVQIASQVSYSSAAQCQGKFYKFENVYRPVQSNKYYSAVYMPYELIKTPEDLFEAVTVVESNPQINQEIYVANKYYYLKNENQPYYILDNSNIYNPYRQYYKLVDLYKEDYEYTIKKLRLEDIIQNSVHTYAKEPYHNIVINDLDNYGLEQITYKGDKPLLAFRNRNTLHFSNLVFAHKIGAESTRGFTINVVDDDVVFSTSGEVFIPDSLTHETTGDNCTVVYYNKGDPQNGMAPYYSLERQYADEVPYSIAVIKYGDDLGYRVTDLTYNGDLITNIGDTLTSVLDKIKQMLGDFEYFYNLDGQFVFQKKKTYVNTSWSQFTTTDDETYITYANDKKKFSFNFEGNRLISAVQNTPVLNNLKNDFVVWGKRTTIDGTEVPIHARYAIDKKPTEYMSLRGILYYTEEALKHPSDQYKDIILNGSNYNSYAYTKNTDIIPQCLIDGDPHVSNISDPVQKRKQTLWYELNDWAEYYHALTGAYPQQMMMRYQQHGGFIGTLTFPDEVTRTFGGQLIIDFYQGNEFLEASNNPDEFVPYYVASPFQHTYNGCGHTYTDFQKRYETYRRMISYIYDPVMPSEDIINADGGHLQPISIKEVDWRELIYQMALDYFAGEGCGEKEPIYDINGDMVINNPDHFLAEVAERNIDMYPSGYTGYEQYYTDMQGFWRQIYNPDYVPQVEYASGYYSSATKKLDNSQFYIKERVWNPRAIADIHFDYYILQNSIGHQVYDALIHDNDLEDTKRQYITSDKTRAGWNVNVFEKPDVLNFWIEFLDEGEELSQFAIKQVGDRQKVVNEDKVTAIIYKEVPDLILYNRFAQEEDENHNIITVEKPDTSNLRFKLEDLTGYTWIYLPKGFSQFLTLSYRGISAKNKIDELLYQYSYCIENISITALPIYHLQPNTRIYVCDTHTNIIGEYIVSKITLPLTYNGTMSIQATLAPERLY